MPFLGVRFTTGKKIIAHHRLSLVGVILACLLIITVGQSKASAPSSVTEAIVQNPPIDYASVSPLSALIPDPERASRFTLQAGENLVFTLDVLELPGKMYPVGMMDSSHGYVREPSNTDMLWLFDYSSKDFLACLDYRESDASLGGDIVFSERWLLWTEVMPYLQHDSGAYQREVRLMARDLDAPEGSPDIQLDIGANTPAEGFLLPFDNIGIQGNAVVYRYSVFVHGNRNTEVRMVDLTMLEVTTLAQASYADEQQILRCGISDSLVAWDVQTRYLHQSEPRLPLTLKATYSIDYLDLTDGRVHEASSVRRLKSSDDYYAPLVYMDQIIALRHHEPEFAWTDPVSENGDGPLVMYGGYHIVNRTVDTSIASLHPMRDITAELLRGYDYALAILEHYHVKFAPRAIQRDELHAGKRLLHWQSNVNEQPIVFDMGTHTIVELPLFFPGMYDDAEELTLDIEYLGVVEHKTFTYLPQLDYVLVQPIAGLDADYLYFQRFDTQEAYLLRVSE